MAAFIQKWPTHFMAGQPNHTVPEITVAGEAHPVSHITQSLPHILPLPCPGLSGLVAGGWGTCPRRKGETQPQPPG